jgi:hypothetical protein
MSAEHPTEREELERLIAITGERHWSRVGVHDPTAVAEQIAELAEREIERLTVTPVGPVSEHLRKRVAEVCQAAIDGEAGCIGVACIAPHQAGDLLDAYDDACAEVERVKAGRMVSDGVYLRALARAYLAADPLCPAEEDGSGEWAIDDVAEAVLELRAELERLTPASGCLAGHCAITGKREGVHHNGGCNCLEGLDRATRRAVRCELARLRGELADERAAHAKTADNFEEYSAGVGEKLEGLRAEVDDARREATDAAARVAALELELELERQTSAALGAKGEQL